MVKLKTVEASTLIENLVAISLVSMAFAAFLFVFSALTNLVQKRELQTASSREISILFSDFYRKTPRDTTYDYEDFQVSIATRSYPNKCKRVDAQAISLGGDTLLTRVRYFLIKER